MPQLSSPTAIHTKRAFSSRGKDQISVSRRKNKEDLPKDTFRNSRELNDESKQIGRFPSSPDGRRQPPLFASGSSTKKESRSGSHSRRSSRGTSDDDDSGPRPRTLAGLLNEIMSKGERMTYEELCNVVLSHWQELRKHNGERYAYSSHSQAVIDCLRNRNEWAQLVDRGPKQIQAGRGANLIPSHQWLNPKRMSMKMVDRRKSWTVMVLSVCIEKNIPRESERPESAEDWHCKAEALKRSRRGERETQSQMMRMNHFHLQVRALKITLVRMRARKQTKLLP